VYVSKKHPEFVVIDKENGGGKFDALNAGLNFIQNPYFVVIDADTVLDDQSFLSLVRPLLTDPTLIAVGASVKIRNGCLLTPRTVSTKSFPNKKLLPVFQTLEYLRAFLERQGWDEVGGNFILAGAFSIFRREEILQVGGYVNTVAEDMEIILRLHHAMKQGQKEYKIMYLPDSVAWTEAPETFKALGNQRAKWHQGLFDSLWYHRSMCFNPKYGSLGCFVYPFWLFGEALEPLVEALGMAYIIVGCFFTKIHVHFFLLFLIATWGFTVLFTALCLLIEEFSFNRYSHFRPMFYLFIYNAFENLGYRQMSVWWRIRGIGRFLRDVWKNAKKIRTVDQQIKKGVFISK
jgi:cellulose synthase/poly-beta-1,6-N-acetylglucosamine synthase-like glycosyltransferase